MHPQLTNMDVQECIVMKGIYSNYRRNNENANFRTLSLVTNRVRFQKNTKGQEE